MSRAKLEGLEKDLREFRAESNHRLDRMEKKVDDFGVKFDAGMKRFDDFGVKLDAGMNEIKRFGVNLDSGMSEIRRLGILFESQLENQKLVLEVLANHRERLDRLEQRPSS